MYNLDSMTAVVVARLYGGTPYAPDSTRTVNWTEEAACAQYPGDLFYPDQGGDQSPAKRICDGCPVRRQCLDDAMRRESDARQGRYGVAGGLGAKERAALHRTGWRPGDELPPIGSLRYDIDAAAPAEDPSATKRCKRCRENLPLSQFSRDRHARSGRKVTCRKCCSAFARAVRQRRKQDAA